jgi:hypothetical protein
MANTTSVAIRKKQLETRLNELNVRLHGIEKTLDKLPPADVEDRATEREEDEVLEGLGTAADQRQCLRRVHQMRRSDFGSEAGPAALYATLPELCMKERNSKGGKRWRLKV